MTLQEYLDRKHAGTASSESARVRRVTLANQRYAAQRKVRAAVSDTRSKADKAKAYYEDYYARNKDKFYRAAYKRRALIKGSQHEHIERHDVFNRDNWRCRSCNAVVNDTVKRGHPRKAIMAHIVALAAGGPHTWDNICCLCHSCNTKDGVNRLPIQTMLPLVPLRSAA